MEIILGESTGVFLAETYPSAKQGIDYSVTDYADGRGPVIEYWSPSLGPAPTVIPVDWKPRASVEKSTTNFSTAEELAAKYLNALKGRVVVYLLTKKPESDAVAAGVAFVDPDTGIGKEYDYFIKAGGHPLAAAKLYQRIQEVKGSFDWFDDQVNAIFAAALTK